MRRCPLRKSPPEHVGKNTWFQSPYAVPKLGAISGFVAVQSKLVAPPPWNHITHLLAVALLAAALK